MTMVTGNRSLTTALSLQRRNKNLRQAIRRNVELTSLRAQLPSVITIIILSNRRLRRRNFITRRLYLLTVQDLRYVMRLRSLVRNGNVLLNDNRASLNATDFHRRARELTRAIANSGNTLLYITRARARATNSVNNRIRDEVVRRLIESLSRDTRLMH